VIALPMVLLGLVAAHFLALHDVGSNNPDGIEIKKKKGPDGHPLDGIPFHPYYTVKDISGAVFFLGIFALVMFFVPEMNGYFIEYNNFVPADPLKTPTHIAPVWYFTPFYSILRAVPPIGIAWLGIPPSQFPGVALFGLSTMIFFLLPWLDRSPVKSIRYRGIYYKIALVAFIVSFLILGYLGTEPTNVLGQSGAWLDHAERATVAARVFTVVYFLFFLLMPWYTAADKCKPEPERVTM
jgi:ubiquinol-cytochrome c reductase cytochrome b subunit